MLPSNMPSYVRRVGMCDRARCRGEQCTYAHNQEERKTWNSILKQEERKTWNAIVKHQRSYPNEETEAKRVHLDSQELHQKLYQLMDMSSKLD